MNLREAAEKAMQALRLSAQTTIRPDVLGCCEQALSALDSALAEAEEPVAWRWGYRSITTGEVGWMGIRSEKLTLDPDVVSVPLYTHPPRREPLPRDRALELLDDVLERGNLLDVIRAVEHAHGIGGGE